MEELQKLMERFDDHFGDIELNIYSDFSGVAYFANTGEEIFEFIDVSDLRFKLSNYKE